MTDAVLHKTIYLRATPDQVWPYLTDPDKLGQWFHKPAAPLTSGTSFEMHGTTSGDKLVWGDVIDARAPEYLEYSFTIKPMGDAVSRVIWRLEAVNGGTRLSLEHSGLPQGAAAFGLILALDKGWDGHIDTLRGAVHDTVG